MARQAHLAAVRVRQARTAMPHLAVQAFLVAIVLVATPVKALAAAVAVEDRFACFASRRGTFSTLIAPDIQSVRPNVIRERSKERKRNVI